MSFHLRSSIYQLSGPAPSPSLLTLARATQRPLPVSLAIWSGLQSECYWAGLGLHTGRLASSEQENAGK